MEKARAAQVAFFQDRPALEGREHSEEVVPEEVVPEEGAAGAVQQTVRAAAASAADSAAVPDAAQGSAHVVAEEEGHGEGRAGKEDDRAPPRPLLGGAREQVPASEQVEGGHASERDEAEILQSTHWRLSVSALNRLECEDSEKSKVRTGDGLSLH